MGKQFWAIERDGFGIGETYIFEGSREEAKNEAKKTSKELGFKFQAKEAEPWFGGWRYKNGDFIDLSPSQG